ncbi:MAG: nuclear transport factor 2 family protein [Anaerolineales bacterium]|jgi:hypothetical protein
MTLREETITRYQAFFENLTDENVEDFRQLAAPEACYRDPFMDSKGHEAITASLHKWFQNLDEIQFILTDHAVNGLIVFQHWIMKFRIRKLPKKLWNLEGVSKITFNMHGMVIDQVDYWDATPMFESVPILGNIITLIKKLLV